MSIPDFRSPSIPARDIGSTVFYAIVERLTRLSRPDTSCPAANPLPRGSVPGVLTHREKNAVPSPTITPTITPQKKQRPGERPGALDDPARRVACRRAHGATGGAAQEEPFARPRGSLSRPHGARSRGSGHRPRRARRTGRRPLDAARRPRAGRRRLGARRRGRCTRGARRAARALTRGRLPRARAAGAKFSPAAAGDAFAARLARTGAPRGAPTAAPAPAAARASDIARIAKTPFTPSVCFWAVGVCLGSHLPEGLLTPIVARGQ